MTFNCRFRILITAVMLLLAASPCRAAFDTLWIIPYACDPQGLEGYTAYRIYARFNNQGDRLIAVFGNATCPISASTSANVYQSPFGGLTAPDSETIAKVPLVEWDSFCTIGLARDDGSDVTTTTPGFPALPFVLHTNLSWFVVPQTSIQNAPDHSGRILIMQLTTNGGFPLNVNVNFTYRPAGSSGTVTVCGATPVFTTTHPGDVNNDFTVNINDLLAIINTWGSTGQGIADVNDDGQVNMDDLLLVLANWGESNGDCF